MDSLNPNERSGGAPVPPTSSAQRLVSRVSAILDARPTVYIFFAILLFVGLAVARDYGISWDEKAMYVLGEEAYNYIFHGGVYPVHAGIRYHGAWFEILQHAMEMLLGLRYARYIFMMRHAMDYIFYWIGLMAIFAIALRAFRHRGWALLATVFLFFSPRIFGHAFINARDIPTMVCFTIKMFTLLYFLDRPTIRRAVLHGVASGLLMSIRVGGLFVPIYVALFFSLRILHDRIRTGRVEWKRYATVLSVYAIMFVLSTIAFWPLLWEHPVKNFLEAMHNMLNDQQAPGGFYMGKAVGNLPWHWVPVNIVTKTPFLYSVLFLAGVTALVVNAWKRPLSLLEENRDVLLFFLWFAIPIIMIVLLDAKLFDEWRHVYFIYPAFILLAVHGLRTLSSAASRITTKMQHTIAQWIIIILCIGSLTSTAWWMIRNHPLEYAYFSIPSRWVDGYFELDYWGVSYRKGFEWILQNDKSDLITVKVTSSPGWENLNILTRDQRRRIVLKNTGMTKYVLDNFRSTKYVHTLPDTTKVHSIQVSGIDVLGIYLNPYWDPKKDEGAQRMENYEIQLRFNPDDML